MIKNSAKEALKEGTILNGKNFRYKIVKVLGLGSFGITYLADIINAAGERTNMQVALKELFIAECNDRKGDEVRVFSKPEMFSEFHRKFSREADNLHRISHSNIINVFESFEANGTVYYSMTFIDGGSLSDILNSRGKLRQTEALETAQVLANALDELHNIGLLHLDVRPQNIMMNGGKVPVLIDFGLAKHFNDDGEPDTSIGLGNGTAGYAPMEQGTYQPGNGIPRCIDVYSLGATLFKMLTGNEPPTASEVFNYGFPKEDMEKAGIPEGVIAVVEKAMQPLWKNRYETAGHFEKAIKIALSENKSDNNSKESVADSSASAGKIAPMIDNDDESTSIETSLVPAYASDEATSIDNESTQVVLSQGGGYVPDEGTQIDSEVPVMQPEFPLNAEYPLPKAKNKRVGAYILIGSIVAVIAILIGSDLYTGWIREIFRTPVECVVLEGNDDDIEIEEASAPAKK